MRIPKDAIVIDTSNLSTEETVERMMDEFNRVFGS
jgi:cytidylate kinase